MQFAESWSHGVEYRVLYDDEEVRLLQRVAAENVCQAQEAGEAIHASDMFYVTEDGPIFQYPPGTISDPVERLRLYSARTVLTVADIVEHYPESLAPEACRDRLRDGDLAGQLADRLEATYFARSFAALSKAYWIPLPRAAEAAIPGYAQYQKKRRGGS